MISGALSSTILKWPDPSKSFLKFSANRIELSKLLLKNPFKVIIISELFSLLLLA